MVQIRVIRQTLISLRQKDLGSPVASHLLQCAHRIEQHSYPEWYLLRMALTQITHGFYDGVKSLPNYMKELGYRACLFNKDGIRKPSDIYEWEFKFVESNRPLPGASVPPIRRHLMTRFDDMEAIMTSDDPRPFCIFHATRLPHTPYLGKLPNGLVGYDASNYSTDQELGRSLELLKKHDLIDSTIVIYVNDNEARAPRTKYTLYDSGVIVPCIVRWPGHIEPRSTTNAMVSFVDFLPTLVDIAGGNPDPVWDGKTMINVWEGKTDHHHDELYFSYTGVIVGNRRCEIPYPMRAFRTQQYKYIRNINHSIEHPAHPGLRSLPEELYDIQVDPREQNNLADISQYQAVKKILSAKVNRWMRETNDHGIESEMETLRKYPAKKRG